MEKKGSARQIAKDFVNLFLFFVTSVYLKENCKMKVSSKSPDRTDDFFAHG